MVTLTPRNIQSLPASPIDKQGWPWTVQTDPLPECMPDGTPWPCISIVTPSYNYAGFVEETIRSVLLQNYPNIEYILIDGGSRDHSVEIIKKYEPYFKYWISEPDKGQTDALNKGFLHCTGDIFVWLNADDAFAHPSCLYEVAKLFAAGNQLIAGACRHVDTDNSPVHLPEDNGYSIPQSFEEYCRFWSYTPLPQPSTFVDRQLAHYAFPLDIENFWAMDFQFFARILKQDPKTIVLRNEWVNFKVHGSNKTCNISSKAVQELYQISTAEISDSHLSWIKKKHFAISAYSNFLILNLISLPPQSKLPQALKCLWLSPSIVLNLLFWKVFLRSLLGDRFYSNVKSVIKI